jgi:hypothetical protein
LKVLHKLLLDIERLDDPEFPFMTSSTTGQLPEGLVSVMMRFEDLEAS